MSYDRDFNNPLFINKEIHKYKPLSDFPFRQLHRTLIEFHDIDLQRECCRLIGIEPVGDSVSFGYCCVDEELGIQIYILVILNRNGTSDCVFSLPEGKEIVLSYSEAKDKIACFSNCYPKPFGLAVERSRRIMEQHEHNPTIMCKDLDPFRDVEFPLDILMNISNNKGKTEKVRFRPLKKKAFNVFEGVLLSEPEDSDLHKGDVLVAEIIYNEKRKAIDVIQRVPVCWIPVNQGENLGETGPNEGTVYEDEEYNGFCRITLEDCYDCFAITCVINEDMKHTAFCKSKDAYKLYEEIKKELEFFSELRDLNNFDELSDFWFDFISYY